MGKQTSQTNTTRSPITTAQSSRWLLGGTYRVRRPLWRRNCLKIWEKRASSRLQSPDMCSLSFWDSHWLWWFVLWILLPDAEYHLQRQLNMGGSYGSDHCECCTDRLCACGL